MIVKNLLSEIPNGKYHVPWLTRFHDIAFHGHES